MQVLYFVAAEFLRDVAAFSIEQFTEISQIDILVVHVRLAFPMHLENYSGHLPVNSTLLARKAAKENLRQFVESHRQRLKSAQIPGGHIDGNASDRIRVLAMDELLYEKLCDASGVDVASVFTRQTA